MRNTRSILWFLLGALIGFAFCYTITTSGGRARPEDVAWAQRARIMREARVADARAEIAVERRFGIPEVAWALQERDAKGVDSDTKDGHLIVFDPTQATHPDNRSRCDPGAPSHALPESGFRASPTTGPRSTRTARPFRTRRATGCSATPHRRRW